MAEPTEGYINLHRRIREHPYWHDPERLKAWIDVLLMAAWKPHRRLVGTAQVDLERGQLIASERFLATRWRWSRGKVRRFLEAAQEANEIRPTGDTSDGTIYTVVKYDTYQDSRPTNGTTDSTSNGPPTVPPSDQIEAGKEREELPIGDLWQVWIEELGGEPPYPKLSTGKRRQRMEALYREQLAKRDDPISVFRQICRAVKRSDHHMSDRTFQYPESLFVNAERRERWTLDALKPQPIHGQKNGKGRQPHGGPYVPGAYGNA